MDSTNFKHLTTEEKNKALGFAAAQGEIGTIKILIAMDKIDLDYQDTLGRTALMWAAKNERLEIVSLLVTAGANVHIADYCGQTPSMLINADSDNGKENSHFISQNTDFLFKHHYYSPVTFLANAPLQERSINRKATANQHSNTENPLENANPNCLMM